MNWKLELYDELKKKKIHPSSDLIDDGEFHIFTDANSGLKYEYCIYSDRPAYYHAMRQPNFGDAA